MEVLRLRNVSYSYDGGVQAIGDVSLTVSEGEIVSIVGPSGCGKSTLLRIIAGLLVADQGHLESKPVPEGRHPVAMVFQEDTLLPWARVKDNAAMYLRFQRRRHRGDEDVGFVRELLAMVGLSEVVDRYPYELSGGMRRRLAVVAAVAARPQLLLLDEPFSALDEPTRVVLHGEVHRLIRRLGISTVLVTHDLAEAICLSERIVLLSRGPSRVVEESIVPFAGERDMLELRSSEPFLELYGALWGALSREITRSEVASDTEGQTGQREPSTGGAGGDGRNIPRGRVREGAGR